MKNYEKYGTNEDLARTYILNHTLHTVETDDLYHDILGFLEWLKEETEPDSLLPCYCGEQPIIEAIGEGFIVRCPNCQAQTNGDFAEKDAILAWNRKMSE